MASQEPVTSTEVDFEELKVAASLVFKSHYGKSPAVLLGFPSGHAPELKRLRSAANHRAREASARATMAGATKEKILVKAIRAACIATAEEEAIMRNEGMLKKFRYTRTEVLEKEGVMKILKKEFDDLFVSHFMGPPSDVVGVSHRNEMAEIRSRANFRAQDAGVKLLLLGIRHRWEILGGAITAAMDFNLDEKRMLERMNEASTVECDGDISNMNFRTNNQHIIDRNHDRGAHQSGIYTTINAEDREIVTKLFLKEYGCSPSVYVGMQGEGRDKLRAKANRRAWIAGIEAYKNGASNSTILSVAVKAARSIPDEDETEWGTMGLMWLYKAIREDAYALCPDDSAGPKNYRNPRSIRPEFRGSYYTNPAKLNQDKPGLFNPSTKFNARKAPDIDGLSSPIRMSKISKREEMFSSINLINSDRQNSVLDNPTSFEKPKNPPPGTPILMASGRYKLKRPYAEDYF